MLLLAHRGASADAPENTLDAFEEALRQGADGVELDVQLCADGQVVVFHDPTLARLSDVAWPVRHTPWRKLRSADVGSRAGFVPARIPLLSEVLSVLPPDVLVNVEVKCESLSDDGLTQRTVEVIRDYRAGERVVISSFNPLVLFRLAQLAPELRRGYLTRPDRPFLLHGRLLAPLVSTWSVHCHHAQVTLARARALREGGLRLAAWTVDAPEEAARLRDAGVDYLITNRPAHLRAALAKRRSATAT